MKKTKKILAAILITAVALQTGFLLLGKARAEVEIPQDVLDIIREYDEDAYDRNVENLTALLVEYDVHQEFKKGIEDLIREGYPLPHILTAYTFLYDRYGYFSDVEQLVISRQQETGWKSIFEGYNQENPPFTPSSFKPDTLDNMLEVQGVRYDDIMIADMVCHRTDMEIMDVIMLKSENKTWKDIKADLDVINSSGSIPRVNVTDADIGKFTFDGTVTEKQVVEAIVTAAKLKRTPEEIVQLVKDGLTAEEILDWHYTDIYY